MSPVYTNPHPPIIIVNTDGDKLTNLARPDRPFSSRYDERMDGVWNCSRSAQHGR